MPEREGEDDLAAKMTKIKISEVDLALKPLKTFKLASLVAILKYKMLEP